MDRHRLTIADMTSLARGPVTAGLVRKLQVAEISKNLMLLEALRRKLVRRERPHGSVRTDADEIESILSALDSIQHVTPGLLRAVLRLPQTGAWTCRSLAAANAGDRVDFAPMTDLVARALRYGPPDNLTGAPELQVSHEDLVLRVSVDTTDPNLDLFGPRVSPLTADEIAIWRARLSGAWQLIAAHDVLLAEAMAVGLTTVVPLRMGSLGRPRSATSGWAFGAVGMSLPPDDLSCAETLVHEFQHLLLGAVLDHFPLVRPQAAEPGYAPWRADPRPPLGLLFGGHAYVGLLGFWRRLGGHAKLKIDRWLDPTAHVIETLDGSEALTPQGRVLNTSMLHTLAGWRATRGDASAARVAKDAAADHRLSWRLRHLSVPDPVLGRLAAAWADGHPPSPVRTRTVITPLHRLGPGARSRLLERATGGHAVHPVPSMDPAARAVLTADYDSAAAAYKARIAVRGDTDAWAGLALCRSRTAPASTLASKPEVVAALHNRLHSQGHGSVDPDLLGAWLDGVRSSSALCRAEPSRAER